MQPVIFYEEKTAIRIARELQAGDPDWRYVAEQRSDRWWAIAIYDEDNELVEYWGDNNVIR